MHSNTKHKIQSVLYEHYSVHNDAIAWQISNDTKLSSVSLYSPSLTITSSYTNQAYQKTTGSILFSTCL